MNHGVAFVGAAAMALVTLGACGDSPMPGRVLGTYKVTGQPQTNTCGLGAPNPWVFGVQLSEQGSTLYWSWLDGSPLLSGPIGSQSQASLKASNTANADSTDAGFGPCNLQRDQDLEIALASGSPAPSFGGTVTYTFTPTTGSQCMDQLAASGGQFSQLPCSVSYMVSGSRSQ